jgi:hypothetical protein
MRWTKQKRIRLDEGGVKVAADINAAVVVNRGEPDTSNQVSSESHVRVVQDSRKRPDPEHGESTQTEPKENK